MKANISNLSWKEEWQIIIITSEFFFSHSSRVNDLSCFVFLRRFVYWCELLKQHKILPNGHRKESYCALKSSWPLLLLTINLWSCKVSCWWIIENRQVRLIDIASFKNCSSMSFLKVLSIIFFCFYLRNWYSMRLISLSSKIVMQCRKRESLIKVSFTLSTFHWFPSLIDPDQNPLKSSFSRIWQNRVIKSNNICQAWRIVVWK